MYEITIFNEAGRPIKTYVYRTLSDALEAAEALQWQYLVGQKNSIKIIKH
jgi:hypothetical protein